MNTISYKVIPDSSSVVLAGILAATGTRHTRVAVGAFGEVGLAFIFI